MTSYRLDFDSEGNLGIYHKSGGSQPDLWIGEILEPESPNPVLVLGIPVGILGVQRILDVFEKWQVAHGPTSGKRQPAPGRRYTVRLLGNGGRRIAPENERPYCGPRRVAGRTAPKIRRYKSSP